MRIKNLYFYLGIFFLAFIFHIIGLNLIGRTWDEQYKVDFGVRALDRVLAADFSLNGWAEGTEHPMVGKYVYGFLSRLEMIYVPIVNGAAALSPSDIATIQNGNYILTGIYDRYYAVPYDFTFARVGSALFNALAVLLTVLFAFYLTKNIWWSGLAGAFLLLTPRFVFLGQLVTFESLSIFLFCLAVYCFNKLLKNPNGYKWYIITGVVSGLFFWTRYNNVIVFPFLLGWIGIHYFFTKDKKILSFKLLIIPVIAFLVGFLIWPYLWYNFPNSLLSSFGFHQRRLEVSYFFYYWNYVLVTTPIPILIGALIGIAWSCVKRSYWHLVLLWWIACIVIVYTALVIPIGGTRLISIIYPALAIFAAYGYFVILKNKFVYVLIPLLLFLLVETIGVFPYNLDYYNQLVGGVHGAMQKGYDFSWWGEGQREVGLWINDNVANGQTVGLIVSPKYVFPSIRPGITFKGYTDAASNANYLVVSRYDENHLPKSFFKNHTLVYQATVGGERLVGLYQKKS